MSVISIVRFISKEVPKRAKLYREYKINGMEKTYIRNYEKKNIHTNTKQKHEIH